MLLFPGASSKLALCARGRVKSVLRCEHTEQDAAAWDAATLEQWAGAAGGRESRSSRIASEHLREPPARLRAAGLDPGMDGNRARDFQTCHQDEWEGGTPGEEGECEYRGPGMECGATGGWPPGCAGLSLSGDSSVVASLTPSVSLLSTSQAKNLLEARVRGWGRLWERPGESHCASGRYVGASVKMCKNPAGPRFLCVPGSAKRFVLPKEKMASSIVFRPFSSGTSVFPSSKHFVAKSFLMPGKV